MTVAVDLVLGSLNLAQLHAFTVIAERGSASRAAAHLLRAQSAVTRSLRELEVALGEPLMERCPSGMRPTSVGEAVLERAVRVFAELRGLAPRRAPQPVREMRVPPGAIPSYLLNTRRLQSLVALVRHRHMQSAAQTLGVSQPAVSSAIKILEAGLGSPLFDRTARGLRLTSDGEAFVFRVRRALNELRHIPEDVAAVRGSIRGSVTVGALPFARTMILPEAVAHVRRDYPGVHVVTDESAYEALLAGLRAGDVDFIIGALRPAAPGGDVRAEALLGTGMVALTRHGHPLAGERGLTPDRLAGADWILPRRHTPARAILDTLFTRLHLPPPLAAVETGDLAMIRGLLMRTDMVAVLSAQQVHYELRAGQLAILDVPLAHTEREIGLTMRAAGEPSPAARRLLDAIRAVARQT